MIFLKLVVGLLIFPIVRLLNSNKIFSDDVRTSEKSSTTYADASNRKSIKPRNRSNSRKNVRPTGVVSNSRAKNNQDFPPRSREKQKNSDGKISGEAKDFKSSAPVSFFKGKFVVSFFLSTNCGKLILIILFLEIGSPIPAPPPTGNAWDKPLTGALRNGSPSTQKLVSSNSIAGLTSGSNCSTTSVSEKKYTPYFVCYLYFIGLLYYASIEFYVFFIIAV